MDGERYVTARLRSWREIADVGPSCGGAVEREGERPRLARSTALALDLEAGTGELSIAADGTLRLRAATGAVLPVPPENAVERSPWLPIPAAPSEGANGALTLSSSHCPLRLEVEREPFAVCLVDRSGAPLAKLCELAFAEGGALRVVLAAGPGDGFFGLGDAPGPLDRRGRHLRLRNADPLAAAERGELLVAIPFFLIHRPGADCCGVLLDTFAAARCDMAATREDRVVLEVASGGLDLLLFPGPLPHDVIARFTGRVGRTSLPPLWALGHHELRRGSTSERAVRALGAEIRRRGIPSDALHIDVGRGLRGRTLAWNPGRFPAPRRLLEDLASTGLRAVGAVSPGVKLEPDGELYRSGCARDAFCKNDKGSVVILRTRSGRTALPDFNRPDVRAWWGEHYDSFCGSGLAGISHSAAAATRRWAALRGARRALRADPADPKRTVAPEQVCNLYGLQQSRATRAALESTGCERRPFVLTRAGTTGIQRYAAVLAGHSAGRWSHLRASVPALLNLSLSGVAFCGADIGGGFWPCAPELFARWAQLGALYPLALTHSGWLAHARQPWRAGRRAERAAHAAMSLRMRLLPYLYGLFREAEADGAPVWRPLFFEFPQDPASPEIEDQFMLGPALLAAPVLERGARERGVYLPPGTWTSWHDDARYTGPRRVTIAAPLERIPLFVRAGSILPLQSAVSHVGMRPAEPCILAVYPGADVSGVLVEDDGETTAYRGGVSARTSLRLWSRAGGRLRLEIGRREGPFRLPERPLRVEIHGCPPPRAVYLDGSRVAPSERAPGWVARDGAVHVRLGDRGAGAALEIDPAP